MRMIAPSPEGVSVGGQHFNVEDGHITVPDDFSSEAIAALLREGFTPADAAPAPIEAEPAPVEVAAPDAEPVAYAAHPDEAE